MSASLPSDSRWLGAVPSPDGGFRFRVWAPRAEQVGVSFPEGHRRRVALARGEDGYFEGADPLAAPGDRYWVSVGRRRLPDPTSRSQPDGTRGASALVDFGVLPAPTPLPGPVDLAHSVLYELHIGTFSPEGTFDGAIPHLTHLARLGVTAVELLPVEDERGERGWGYGPVHQFAVRRAYGGPGGLLRFVAAAHREGLGVLLDVVYNHWGRDARFLERFGPYFHPRASTPWGPTPNVDGPGSEHVRRYFQENARLWLETYGVDGFRLDAVHEVFDRSSRPFWREIAGFCHDLGAPRGRRPILVAESDFNDVRILRPPSEGGWGLDAQWSDDFHHALHAALTGERAGYYVDYGPLPMLARAFERPFLFEGEYSKYHDRPHGAPAGDTSPQQFVVFDQNHDQVGNRGDGARLARLLPPGLGRVALGLTLFAPYVPMLFMGEEYGETRPFYFFTDPPRAFARRVAAGRLQGLQDHGFPDPPPDPSDPATFDRSHLDWERPTTPEGRAHLGFVRELLRLRRELPALAPGGSVRAWACEEERQIVVRRERRGASALLLANLSPTARPLSCPESPGVWRERFHSEGPAPARAASDRPETWTLTGGSTPAAVRGHSFLVLELDRSG
ncbi:MAG TPA: malto-oligosyltrehalose trehalohydrolase [Thermoplasmata archaeon]|nr:malto-oligosyltrehalose trehalohydrolase [Thermoplasmata archaeon]